MRADGELPINAFWERDSESEPEVLQCGMRLNPQCTVSLLTASVQIKARNEDRLDR